MSYWNNNGLTIERPTQPTEYRAPRDPDDYDERDDDMFAEPDTLTADEREALRLADEAAEAAFYARKAQEDALSTCEDDECGNGGCDYRRMPGSDYCWRCRGPVD